MPSRLGDQTHANYDSTSVLTGLGGAARKHLLTGAADQFGHALLPTSRSGGDGLLALDLADAVAY
ncbi:MAG: hypothetical protein QUV06_14730 [Cyanobium sp. CZS 48M]|nr:hypothetical protein [Cyanobium sp. CZS48M]